MLKPRIDNDDVRHWFLKIYKHNINSTAGMPVPQKVFTYLQEKTFVVGTYEECRLSPQGSKAIRQIFSEDELRGKYVKPQLPSTISPAPKLF
jgi:hypothetical protein